MSRTLRIRKNGQRVYEIRVSRGRDPLTGKQLTPYSMTYVPPENYSDKRAEKEAAIVEAEFKVKCKNGEILTKQEQKQKKQEAQAKEEREKLEYTNSPCPSLVDSIDWYVKQRSTELKTGTIEYTIILSLNKLKAQLGDDIKVRDITKGMMKKVSADLFQSGITWDTASNTFITWNRFFKELVEDGVITENPMDGIRKPRRSKNTEDDSYKDIFSDDELSIMYKAIETESTKWKCLFYFTLDTGMRVGEVCGLKRENIDFETGKIKVCNNVQYSRKTGIYETTPKNGKYRELFLSDYVLKMVRDYDKQHNLSNIFKGIPETVYFFDNDKDGCTPH